MHTIITSAQAEALLVEHGVRPTANRIAVCRALAQAHTPISMLDLETSLDTIDRSGISRTLSIFRKCHMVHVIEDGSASVKYELCHSHHHSSAEADTDTHAHFYCTHCGSTTCLEQLAVPAVRLPEGFKALSTNFLIKGLCPRCSGKDSAE